MANEQETKTNKQTDFLMSPKVDYCFKELMNNPETRRGFISAVLGISPDDIGKTTLEPSMTSKEHADDKWGVLDVHVSLLDGTHLDLEMQLTEKDSWDKRTLFYLSKMYTRQIKEGENYNVLKKSVHVGILDFEFLNDSEKYHSCFHLWEDSRRVTYSDIFELHTIELPKIKKYEQENSELLKWAKFFNCENREEFEMAAESNVYIEKAYDDLQVISADERKRLEYEFHLKAKRDKSWFLENAYNRGVRDTKEEYEQRLIDKDKELEENKKELEEKDRIIEELQEKLNNKK